MADSSTQPPTPNKLTILNDRDTFNRTIGRLGAALGSGSLIAGLCYACHNGQGHPLPQASPTDWWPYVVLGAWTLLPPIFFWVDWVCFRDRPPTLKHEDKEEIIHTHDVSRNIWVALALILAALFHIDVLPGK
jgi:hypothetical protein